MNQLYDVAALGNAIMDVISPCEDSFLVTEGLAKGGMTLVDEATAIGLHGRMNKEAVLTSGGSAANTIAGLASFGGTAAFIGKVADDETGAAYVQGMKDVAQFNAHPLVGGPGTGRCLINVTPDGQRTMTTFLGAAAEFSDDDVDPAIIEAAAIVYLEGYLFNGGTAQRAFAKAAALAHGAGRKIALTLSDTFVVNSHRPALLGFIETQVDLLFANEAELCALFETDFDTAIKLIGPMTRIAAVTRSEKGSVVAADGAYHAVPAYPIDRVLDTTGAGDQYAAGFCYGLSHGKTMEDCARLGSLAACEVISHYGPRPNVSLKELAIKAGL
jgi:sugar/nucleoside kinase (ribokinase family)